MPHPAPPPSGEGEEENELVVDDEEGRVAAVSRDLGLVVVVVNGRGGWRAERD